MKNKILVTGGLGFIGSHTVVELIKAGFDPVIIDNLSNSELFILDRISQITGTRPTFYDGDCCDKLFLHEVFEKEENFVGVIHFAAYKSVGESVQNPLKYYENNLVSTINVLQMIEEYSVKSLIFSSSATVYGTPSKNPILETETIKSSSSSYGTSKIFCEKIIQDFSSINEKTNIVSLRYFNPIGAHTSGLIGELPKGKPNNLVPYLAQSVAGVVENLTVFGTDYPTIDGSCVRDYVHVSDLAEAHVAALNFALNQNDTNFEVFNVGTGTGTSVLELISIFEKENNIKVLYTIGARREGDIAECYANVDKIKNFTGWHSQKTIQEALKDVWTWQKNLR